MKKTIIGLVMLLLIALTVLAVPKDKISIENEVFELKGKLVDISSTEYITNANIENLKVNGVKYSNAIYLHTDFSEYGEPTRTVIRNTDLYIELVDGEVRYFWVT